MRDSELKSSESRGLFRSPSSHLLICALIVHLFLGCSPSMSDYNAAVRNGTRTVPHVREITRTFPNAPTDHFITQYGFQKNKPVLWNTELFFGNRYVLTYQVYLVIDYKQNRIISTTNSPRFTLAEIGRVYNTSPETIGADIVSDHKFGEAEWEKVVASRGDFSVIGIQLNTNPTPRFDDFVHGVRKDRASAE